MSLVANAGRPRLLVGLTGTILLSGLLAGWTGAEKRQDGAEVQSQDATTAQAGPSTTPTYEDEQASARDQLLSGLIGGKHDFTGGGKIGRDLCLPCHTPHLRATPPPRWDRRAATTQPLRPFEGLDVELGGWSLLCLGCHDGVTAPDVYSSTHALSVVGDAGGLGIAGRGLRSHPVGVRYPPAGVRYPVAPDKYNPIAVVEAAGLLVPDGRIECTTCHDAHNTRRQRAMLRVSNERSRLCLICHRI